MRGRNGPIPGLTGLARTFTGNFLLGPPGKIYGPFRDPKQKAMANATGMVPEHSEHVKSAEMCASCHTVHLPVLHRGKPVARTYEQATYPEWAFSAYRTGTTPDGALPLGARRQGADPARTATCRAGMPFGLPYQSKIATIQEYSNFPQAEHTLPAQEIDLPVREGYARHTLVGLNLFLIKMAQQFPQLLGIRTEDPMLTAKRGIDPLTTTENAMLDQAQKPHRRRQRRRGPARSQRAERQGDRSPTWPGTNSPRASRSAAPSSSSACSMRATACCGRPDAPTPTA